MSTAKKRRITQRTDFLREPFTFSVTFECDPTVARSAHYLLAQALARAGERLGIPTLTSDIHDVTPSPDCPHQRHDCSLPSE
jgi:hypothetical protein